MKAIAETKRIDGKPAHREAGAPRGAWIIAKSEIDAMLDRVQKELEITRTAVLDAIGADPATISKCRSHETPVLERWILRMSDYSGIPVAELRQVACVAPAVPPHPRARRT